MEYKDRDFTPVLAYAKNLRAADLNFNSEHLNLAESYYVAWIDLMGAGHVMTTSVQKSANFLARLHMAVERARRACDFTGRLLPINDGIFIVANRKREIISMVGRIMIMLAANFVAVPRPHDRFLLRGGIAYGPTYFGKNLITGIRPKKFRMGADFLDRMMFGPALIQAYRGEAAAPPYGIAVHESARVFCPPGDEPFRMTHWMWWAPNEDVNYPSNLPPLTDLKDCLCQELKAHFKWLTSTSLYHGLDRTKIFQWQIFCEEYFQLG